MYWANFLHIYQPPTQTREIVEKVTKECYRPLVKILKENKRGRITLNINACLCEQLVRYGFSDVVDGLGGLAQEGRVELTGSAKYHPILPLIPDDEVERQIELNQKANESFFKGVYKPKGFFPPEMCYSKKAASIVKKMGFEWIIVDEISYNGKLRQYKTDTLYYVKGLEHFRVFFKERRISAAVTYGKCSNLAEFKGLNKDILDKNVYLLSGTDGEVYGHHRPGQEKLLIEAFNDPGINTCTISQLSEFFTKNETVEPLASSWSTWEDELKAGVPYPQWDYPGNNIHALQWELARLAMESVNNTKESSSQKSSWQEARALLDEGLHSCQWWWVGCRPWFDTQMADKGARVLADVALKLKDCGIDKSALEKAEKLRQDIHDEAMSWYTSGKYKTLQQEYMASHGDVASLLTFG